MSKPARVLRSNSAQLLLAPIAFLLVSWPALTGSQATAPYYLAWVLVIGLLVAVSHSNRPRREGDA